MRKKIFELKLRNVDIENKYFKISLDKEIKKYFLKNFHSQKKNIFLSQFLKINQKTNL